MGLWVRGSMGPWVRGSLGCDARVEKCVMTCTKYDVECATQAGKVRERRENRDRDTQKHTKKKKPERLRKWAV